MAQLFSSAIPVPSPRHSARHAVVVGTMYALDEPKPLYVDVLPIAWIIKGHRIGMAGVEPADGARTDAGQDDPLLVGCPEKPLHPQTSPHAHHVKRIPATHIDDVC